MRACPACSLASAHTLWHGAATGCSASHRMLHEPLSLLPASMACLHLAPLRHNPAEGDTLQRPACFFRAGTCTSLCWRTRCSSCCQTCQGPRTSPSGRTAFISCQVPLVLILRGHALGRLDQWHHLLCNTYLIASCLPGVQLQGRRLLCWHSASLQGSVHCSCLSS